MKHKAT